MPTFVQNKLHETYYVANLDEKAEEYTALFDDLRVKRPVERSNVVSSELVDKPGMHTIMLDLDVPAVLVESSTPGHTHLFINVEVEWPKYADLLDALADAGVIESGYRDASIMRGHTALRLPWIKKNKKENAA